MSRNQPRTKRVFIMTYGEGPWSCTWCGKPISTLGRSSWDGQIHHLDHNVENDDPENLVIGHCVCHQRDHHQGKPKSQEHSTKVGARHKGRKITWASKIQTSRRRSGTYDLIICTKCGIPISGGVGNMRQHQRGVRCVTSS